MFYTWEIVIVIFCFVLVTQSAIRLGMSQRLQPPLHLRLPASLAFINGNRRTAIDSPGIIRPDLPIPSSNQQREDVDHGV